MSASSEAWYREYLWDCSQQAWAARRAASGLLRDDRSFALVPMHR